MTFSSIATENKEVEKKKQSKKFLKTANILTKVEKSDGLHNRAIDVSE